MNEIKTTKKNYRITLESTEDIDVNDVYNRIFFTEFDLKDIRIYKHNSEELVDLKDKNTNFDSNKIVDTFGEEKYPNGYSELPLKKEDFVEKEENENENLYDMLTSYISKYVPKEKVSENNIKIDVVIPLIVDKPIMSLDNIVGVENDDNLININNYVDYKTLEKILHDLYIQIQYFIDKGYFFSEFPLSSIYFVQDKYIFLDMNTIGLLKNDEIENRKKLNNAILDLTKNILKFENNNVSLIDQLTKIKHTNLYYFLKRIEYEGLMLWIH